MGGDADPGRGGELARRLRSSWHQREDALADALGEAAGAVEV